jgi:hypothetical protein
VKTVVLERSAEMSVFYIFAAPGALILLACCLVFGLKKKHGFWAYFLLGWTLLMLLSLPAGIWQSVFGWSHLTMSGPLWKRFLLPLVAWPFNAAGYSVRLTFEVFRKEIWGSKGHILEYWLLMAVQVSITALIFAVRYKRRKTFVDWGIICLCVLFLVNSLVNVSWYWGVG